MKISRAVRLFHSAAIFLCSTAVTPVSRAEIDIDLFAPDRLIEIEVKMDPDDWQALRISHRTRDEDPASLATSKFDYYRGDVVIDGQKVGSVGVRKKRIPRIGDIHSSFVENSIRQLRE